MPDCGVQIPTPACTAQPSWPQGSWLQLVPHVSCRHLGSFPEKGPKYHSPLKGAKAKCLIPGLRMYRYKLNQDDFLYQAARRFLKMSSCLKSSRTNSEAWIATDGASMSISKNHNFSLSPQKPDLNLRKERYLQGNTSFTHLFTRNNTWKEDGGRLP